MSDELIIGAAAAMIVMYLVGRSAIWRILKSAAESLLIILALIRVV